MADMIRLQRSGGYTVLPNGILRDTNLSLKTKGLFAIILSLPEGWDYSVAGLATVAGCGRDAIRGALKEMETAGYLTRMRAHGEGGKFTGVVYTIRDEDRAKAVEQWDALPGDQGLMEQYGSEDALLHDIAVGLKRHLDCEDWREGRGIPYAFRWLRDRKWQEKRKTAQALGSDRPPGVTYGWR